METNFFSEIEKTMNLKTIKDFEKEVRTKIINEFETLRKKNDDLSRVLISAECEMWNDIKDGKYSWLSLTKNKKKKLFRLIDIYSNFSDIVDEVKRLNTKVDEIKKLKDEPEPMDPEFVLKIKYSYKAGGSGEP